MDVPQMAKGCELEGQTARLLSELIVIQMAK